MDLNKEIQKEVAIITAALTSIVTKAVAARLQGQTVELLDNHEGAKTQATEEVAAEKKAAPAKKAAPKTAPAKKEAPKTEDKEPEAKTSSKVTDKDLRSKLQQIAKQFSPSKSYELLDEFGASKVNDVAEKDYDALNELLDKTLAGDAEAEEEDF